MCAMARKAATSIFRADDEDEHPETEVEVTNSQTGSELLQTGNGCPYTKENHDTSSPLSIPKESSVATQNSNMQLSDIAISAFSKMSIGKTIFAFYPLKFIYSEKATKFCEITYF